MDMVAGADFASGYLGPLIAGALRISQFASLPAKAAMGEFRNPGRG
jgi:hypothetical protein